MNSYMPRHSGLLWEYRCYHVLVLCYFSFSYEPLKICQSPWKVWKCLRLLFVRKNVKADIIWKDNPMPCDSNNFHIQSCNILKYYCPPYRCNGMQAQMFTSCCKLSRRICVLIGVVVCFSHIHAWSFKFMGARFSCEWLPLCGVHLKFTS